MAKLPKAINRNELPSMTEFSVSARQNEFFRLFVLKINPCEKETIIQS